MWHRRFVILADRGDTHTPTLTHYFDRKGAQKVFQEHHTHTPNIKKKVPAAHLTFSIFTEMTLTTAKHHHSPNVTHGTDSQLHTRMEVQTPETNARHGMFAPAPQ